jgi:ribulose-phosphate 3-epimerase
MNEVIPGINEVEWNEVVKKLEEILPFAKTVHIDLMDGNFVTRKTFADPTAFTPYTDRALFEVHMMVENPIEHLTAWAEAGFERFLGHIEMMPDPAAFIAQARSLGRVGLAIDGPTSLDTLNNFNLNDLDCLLLMTVKAGESGRPFQDELLEKVRKIKETHGYLPIEVDGGINNETIVAAKEAGANRFVTTSDLFSAQNIEEKYRKLTSLIL